MAEEKKENAKEIKFEIPEETLKEVSGGGDIRPAGELICRQCRNIVPAYYFDDGSIRGHCNEHGWFIASGC